MFLESKIFSSARSSGHTFEFIGYGPGNYSTSMPQLRSKTITLEEEIFAQAREFNGGIIRYTGMNDRGIAFSGNKKISTITGKEEIFSSDAPTLLFLNEESQLKEKDGIEIAKLKASPNLFLEEVVNYLAEEKLINNLMVEAGSGIMNSLLQERLIDELVLYKAPKLLGENRLSFINLDVVTKKLGTIDLEIEDIEELGQDIKHSLVPKY